MTHVDYHHTTTTELVTLANDMQARVRLIAAQVRDAADHLGDNAQETVDGKRVLAARKAQLADMRDALAERGIY